MIVGYCADFTSRITPLCCGGEKRKNCCYRLAYFGYKFTPLLLSYFGIWNFQFTNFIKMSPFLKVIFSGTPHLNGFEGKLFTIRKQKYSRIDHRIHGLLYLMSKSIPALDSSDVYPDVTLILRPNCCCCCC